MCAVWLGGSLRGRPSRGSTWTPQGKCGAAEQTQLARREDGEDAANNRGSFLICW